MRTWECALRASFSIKGVKLITTTGIALKEANWYGDKADEEKYANRRRKSPKDYQNAKGQTCADINMMLDEIQEVQGFEKIVNGLRNKDNVDVYTGSNAKFLSKEISTIFRDRGQEIRCNPLSFKEYCTERTEPLRTLYGEYYTYGGMPGLLMLKTPVQKAQYLQDLWNKTYLTDIKDRYHIENDAALEALADVLCSSIGSLSNPTKIANSIKSIKKLKLDEETVKLYLDYICDSFLFEGSAATISMGKTITSL